ncbi:MAG: B3/4 domain-containing protein [Fidelibacterota bacterium]
MNFTCELDIKYRFFTLSDIKVENSRLGYEKLVECGTAYLINHSLPLSKIPGVRTARDLFRQLKIDPTRHRPSSEALLRRAMKEKGFYSVNNVVDVCNWCALDFLLPNGVYDLDKIHGDIVLREGKPGESYTGLNNKPVNLAGRFCLADEKGPFGSPITDSKRTSVDLNTTNIGVIIYAPHYYDSDKLEDLENIMVSRIKKSSEV